MCKRLVFLASLVMLLVGAPVFAGVGVFDNAADIGGPRGIGSTVSEGYKWTDDSVLVEQYLLTGGGGDIWGNSDQFHYAYKMLEGDVRITAAFQWVCRNNDWSKMGVMLRDMSGGTNGGAVQYNSITRKNIDGVFFQRRTATNGGSGSTDIWNIGSPSSIKLGIQRVYVGAFPFVEAMYDNGSGWTAMGGPMLAGNLPKSIGVGVAVTSHDNNWLAQARAWDVQYQKEGVELLNPIQLATVPGDAALQECPNPTPGFMIRSIKLNPIYVQQGGAWGYAIMNELLDTGGVTVNPPGIFLPGVEAGMRYSQFVNVRDTGDGAFGNNESFPGIDPFEYPAADPAAGDDDNNFATEVLAFINLSAGTHMIGANSDDGTIIEIGGVEVARTGEWKGASNEDFLFNVEVAGIYSLRARSLEGGGGSSLELHEVLPQDDGTFKRVLLGDVENGGSAVCIPEPATIALLGFGGLAMLRIRKRR